MGGWMDSGWVDRGMTDGWVDGRKGETQRTEADLWQFLPPLFGGFSSPSEFLRPLPFPHLPTAHGQAAESCRQLNFRS